MATGYLDNFYARLGIPQNATQEEIRVAYHKAALRFHPDHNKDKGSTEVFLQIQEAYETLSNPDKRSTYDKLLPSDLTVPKNVLTNAIYSRRTLTAIDRPQLVYVLLNMMALPGSSDTQPKRQPLNVCLVLDTSTSMSGSRMTAVKDTALQIIKTLDQHDILSVVTFNDHADVIIPATRGQNINVLQARISIINTAGGTEIGKGLEAGYQEIKRNLHENYQSHIILITDGRTYGDEQQCLEIARLAAEQSITIHTLGIGNQWNDNFLDALASQTGGSCEFAQTANTIQRFLQKKFGQMQNTFAHNVILEFHTLHGVEMRYAFRLSPDTSSIPLNNTMPFGDIPKQMSLSILMEFLIQSTPMDVAEYEFLDGKLSFTLPSAPIPNVSSRLTFSLPVTSEPHPEPPPQVLVRAMSRLSLYRLQEMAQLDLQKGDVHKASQRLKNLATQLLSSGEDQLAKTVMLELDQIRIHQTMNEDAKKQIKFGTRALIMEPGQEEIEL